MTITFCQDRKFRKFNGDPLQYRNFKMNFETHIESKFKDPKILLCLLLQHFEPKLRNRFQHFTDKGDAGYLMALERLEMEYGQPCIIVDAYEQRLKQTDAVKSNDPDSLKRFSELLEKTLIVLEDIQFYGSINSLDTMTYLVNKLPFDMRKSWVKEATTFQNRNKRIADFTQFVQFVARKSQAANSLYGHRVLGSQFKKGPTTSFKAKKTLESSSTCTTTTAQPDKHYQSDRQASKCYFCNSDDHLLLQCPKLNKTPVEERSKFVKSRRLCYKCLSARHRTYQCRRRAPCTIKDCKGTYHHTLLHIFKETKSQSSAREAPVVSTFAATNSTLETKTHNETRSVYLCIVPVRVRYGNEELHAYAFLDQGSTHTFCDKAFAEKLQVSKQPEQLHMQTLTGTQQLEGFTCALKILPLDSDEEYSLTSVFVLDDIPIRPNLVPAKGKLQEMPHLKDIEFPQIKADKVTLLIGADIPELFLSTDYRKGRRGQPTAIKTPLGWSLLGPSLTASLATNCFVGFVNSQDEVLHKQICSLWETDFQPETSLQMPTSREDRITLELFKSSVVQVAGHYQLPLPWKPNVEQLPNSLSLSQRRLVSLKKRLLKDAELFSKYSNTIDSYIEKGYARRVPTEQLDSKEKVWYLPHHPVYHPHKPNKVRIVFDCAAKQAGISLNDALMSGPDLINSLLGVLIRFRKNPIALVADIESMFHQVFVHPSHCNALRFLWWPQGNLKVEPVPHQMLVHIFGATSSPVCAAFCLRQTALDFGKQYDSFISDIVDHNFYVDDCLVSVDTASQAIAVVEQLTSHLRQGGFRLTKWLTNDETVLEAIPQSERSKTLEGHDLDCSSNNRVLGVKWNFIDDVFFFSVKLPKSLPLTRRGLLSMLSSIFDPLGLLAPIMLCPKIVLQELCRNGFGWDDPIPESHAKRWTNWVDTLPLLEGIQVRRCFQPYTPEHLISAQLHHFSDASQLAYGACSYLRLLYKNGQIHCSLLIGKSRLAPIKSISVPRLELTAAVLASKLDLMLRKELSFHVTSTTFWSDSTAVLHMIANSSKRFPVFVSNRIATIERNVSQNSLWKYVPSQLNPADLTSRGITAREFSENSTWLNGPDFLSKPEECWPQSPDVSQFLLPLELLPRSSKKSEVFLAVDTTSTDRLLERYSSFHSLLKTTSWLIRYKSFLLAKVKRTPYQLTEPISVSELQTAEIELIKYVQIHHFPSLIKMLNSQRVFKKGECPRYLSKLQPIVIKGVLRVGGRLANAPVDWEVKHPIILPSDSIFTKLLIEKHHTNIGHGGMSHTWTSLRQKYWVVKGASTVRRILGKCILCSRRNATAGQQLMADLPESRLQSNSPPFSYIGVDYFGPFFVKQGRSKTKRYGCIFSCLTTRAVHIEVAADLSTDSFINALRRFISRRGHPQKIWSDNGTNFVGAERVLREALKAWNKNQINNYLRQREISWQFNPPTASHMGGSWERMIRSIRRILSTLLHTQIVSDDVLSTLMAEVEGILNSRPLTPVILDPKANEALTPNHLLLLRGTPNIPPGIFEKRDCYAKRRWAQVQYLANQFWFRWVREFLPSINSRSKWQLKSRNFQENDLVLVVDQTQPRSRWALGRVIQIFPDKNGVVRTALVKTALAVMKRPITKLCLVEANQ